MGSARLRDLDKLKFYLSSASLISDEESRMGSFVLFGAQDDGKVNGLRSDWDRMTR